jgi:isocitrate dehydrogenase (NAD+)
MATPGTKYGLRYTVSLIPGDGTGKEVTKAVKDVLKAANAPVDWEEIPLSGYDNVENASTLLSQTIESIKRNKIAFKGIIFIARFLNL